MCDHLSQFAAEKHLHLKGVIGEENCAILSDAIKKFAEEKKSTTDAQCPLSQSIHGAEIFDQLMLEASGKKLLPTYSYARLYVPGEELLIHVDRPACEISATITLGFEGNIWPIYMGDDENKANAQRVNMDVGDAVIYYGMDKYHWREKYTEGQWQTQVFLHYVDADGDHTEWLFDKRSNTVAEQPTDSLRYRYFEDVLTPSQCDAYIEKYTGKEYSKLLPYIGGSEELITIDTRIRNTERVDLETYKELGGQLAAVGFSANHFNWQFDVTHANQAEFLSYPTGGRYTPHVDTFLQRSQTCRKLTVLAFLNDDFKGGRFYIQDGHERFYPPQNKGTVVVFPSFMLHGVEDIEEGTRYSAVCWMAGPFFK
jgi:predicted 2-oxoglutarate/Fe(II)-dependent dioxygenase YbiX